jgi:hypothetical protein
LEPRRADARAQPISTVASHGRATNFVPLDYF